MTEQQSSTARNWLLCAGAALAPAVLARLAGQRIGLKPLLAGSSQTDDSVAVPHGHYAAENMKLTVVPNRNMLLLAVATAWAINSGILRVNGPPLP